MEPSFKRDQNHNYMVLESPEAVQGSEYQVRMLLMNKIPGLLECRMRILDGRPVFYYEITSRQPLTQVYEKTGMGTEGLGQLLGGLRKGMDSFRRYLLDVNDLILDPAYIYVDPEEGDVFLCCLPFYQSDVAREFRTLTEYILKHLDHGSEGAVLWGYEIYREAARENYNLEEILKSVYRKPEREKGSGRETGSGREKWQEPAEDDTKRGRNTEEREYEKKEKDVENKRKVNVILKLLAAVTLAVGAGILLIVSGVSLVQTGGIFCLVFGVGGYIFCCVRRGDKRKEFSSEKPKRRQSSEIRETAAWEEVWEEEEPQREEREEIFGETAALTGETQKTRTFLWCQDPESGNDLPLSGKRQVIGKLSQRVDLVISSPEVSRIHARVERKEDGYYLTDLNSKNGTFVNGIRLAGNENRRLTDGDRVCFGGMSYFFKDRLEVPAGIHYNEMK